MKKSKLHALAVAAGFRDVDDSGVWISDGYWDKELSLFASLIIESCAQACGSIGYSDQGAKFYVPGFSSIIRSLK